MRGVPTRITANAVWVLIFSGVVVLGAFLSFASGILFEDTYPLTVPMPEAGGVLPGQEVTVMGRAVGVVEDVELAEDGVLITLEIQSQYPVPEEANVQVLRRSPIGEQSVNFTPVDEQWAAAEQGAHIVPAQAQTPASVPVLLEKTVELFEAMDLDSVSTVFAEAADALRGRGETLRELNRDSLDLNRTLVTGIPDFERAIESSDIVLTVLRDHRQSLAESFTNAANLTEVLGEQRPNMETLLDTGTTFVNELDAFFRNEDANLHCFMSDLTDINEMLLGPSTATGEPARFYDSKLDEFEMALVKNRYFFQEGYALISQPHLLTGADWIRVLMLPPQEEHGEMYAERTPTPATRPGAACTTDAWGVGVQAIRQPNHQPPAPTSPGIEYAPLVAGGEQSGGDGGGGSAERGAPLPATGGGWLVLAPLTLGLALWLRRRG